MPAIRIGFGSDFSLVNQLVGVGTTAADFKLEVTNTLKGDFNVTGFTTLTKYGGFVSQRQNISLASTVGFTTTGIGTVGITSFISVNEVETGFVSLVGEFNTLAEDLIIDEGRIFDVSTIRNIGITTLGTQSVYVPNGSTVCVGKLESVNIGAHFSVPNGGIAARTQNPVEGMVRFNNDLNTLEFYNGVEWRQFTVTGASGRGVFMGGQTPSLLSSMEYVNIHSGGNGINFGTLAQGGTQYTAGCSSSTRGILGGGYNPAATPGAVSDTIEYITIASEGNSIDFGNLSDARGELDACSSSTRGVFCGGEDIPFANMNVIDYIEIATLGNALDFGDMNTATRDTACLSSPTRGIIAGGVAADRTNRIESFTIAAKGNSVYFGDLTSVKNIGNGGCSNSVRGLFAGGQVPYTTNVIDSITIASNGNAQDFGDLSQGRNNVASVSTQVRGMWGGGYGAPAFRNNIDYVTIASTGNAQDFGDLTTPRNQHSACSDSHGGLGGF